MSDPAPEPGKLVGIQMPDDRGQSVVPRGTSFLSQPETAERKMEVVNNHQEISRREFEPIEDFFHCNPRVVHVGQRLDKEAIAGGRVRIFPAPCPESDLIMFGEFIKDGKSDIM